MCRRGAVEMYLDDKLCRCPLAEQAVVQGFPCAAKHDIIFYKGGRLAEFHAAEEFTNNNILVKEVTHTRVWGNNNLRMLALQEDMEIQGYLCNHDKGWYWDVEFHKDGSLYYFKPNEDIEIEGFLCPKYTTVHLYPNGGLMSFLLAETGEIAGMSCKGESTVWMYPDKSLMTISLAEDKSIQDVPCSHEGEIDLYPEGPLLSCKIAEDFSIGDVQYKEGDKLLFTKEGEISEYDYNKAWKIKEEEQKQMLDQLPFN